VIGRWLLAAAVLAVAAFCSGTETALTALGDARARQLRERGGRRQRLLSLWIDHPERVLATLLIGNTLTSVGAGALAAALAGDVAGWTGLAPGSAVAITAGGMTAAVLFLGEIVPKMLAKRHPVRAALLAIPLVHVLCFALWPLSFAVSRATTRLLTRLGLGAAGPSVTGEEIEYLIAMGTREGVLDAVKEELLNSVLEFADRVVREVMVPRTRIAALDRDLPPEELARLVGENPYSRMPVYQGSIDNVVGILIVRELVGAQRGGGAIDLARHLKPAYFVPEGMKISRLLKEMQRRHTHLAVVVDEFGGTSGLVTLEDVLEEIVGEIQDEADVEPVQVRALSRGVYLADAAVPLHELEAFLNERPPGEAAEGGELPAVRFPDEAGYETLGGFVTATAGKVLEVGVSLTWGGLTFTVRAADERQVRRVEIARPGAAPAAPAAGAAPGVRRG
jgi:putative hemolysin